MNVTAVKKPYMPGTEVPLSGRLPSGQHSSTGSCWLTESETWWVWDLWQLEWVLFTWKFLLPYFVSFYGCVWETWAVSAPAALQMHPGASRFVWDKDCTQAPRHPLSWICSKHVSIIAERAGLSLRPLQRSSFSLWELWLRHQNRPSWVCRVTCFVHRRSACMTRFCKTHVVLEQHSQKQSRQDFVVGEQQTNDAGCPFGGCNYSTVKLCRAVPGSSASGTQKCVGRPWAPCTALSSACGKLQQGAVGCSCLLRFAPSHRLGSASNRFGIAGGPWVVGVCDTLWMSGCQRFKLSLDYQYCGGKQVNDSGLLIGCMWDI